LPLRILAIPEGRKSLRRQFGGHRDPPPMFSREALKGCRVFALDGNHLQESEKRLEPWRPLHDAPLPSTIVARFDLPLQLSDPADTDEHR
jgi:hypothetical protein